MVFLCLHLFCFVFFPLLPFYFFFSDGYSALTPFFYSVLCRHNTKKSLQLVTLNLIWSVNQIKLIQFGGPLCCWNPSISTQEHLCWGNCTVLIDHVLEWEKYMQAHFGKEANTYSRKTRGKCSSPFNTQEWKRAGKLFDIPETWPGNPANDVPAL